MGIMKRLEGVLIVSTCSRFEDVPIEKREAKVRETMQKREGGSP